MVNLHTLGPATTGMFGHEKCLGKSRLPKELHVLGGLLHEAYLIQDNLLKEIKIRCEKKKFVKGQPFISALSCA